MKNPCTAFLVIIEHDLDQGLKIERKNEIYALNFEVQKRYHKIIRSIEWKKLSKSHVKQIRDFTRASSQVHICHSCPPSSTSVSIVHLHLASPRIQYKPTSYLIIYLTKGRGSFFRFISSVPIFNLNSLHLSPGPCHDSVIKGRK
jgi:hypothetical protein